MYLNRVCSSSGRAEFAASRQQVPAAVAERAQHEALDAEARAWAAEKARDEERAGFSAERGQLLARIAELEDQVHRPRRFSYSLKNTSNMGAHH